MGHDYTNLDGKILTCGFFLPPKQEKEAIKISKHIADIENINYVLNDSNKKPYIRLYEIVIPKKNINIAAQKIKQIISNMVAFTIKWNDDEITQNIIVIWGKLNDEIRLFQKTIALEIEPLREGYYKQKYEKYYEDTNDSDEKESLAKWGWPWFIHYKPYMVLAQSQKPMQLNQLDFEWEYETCLLKNFFFAIKTAPATFDQITTIPLKEIIIPNPSSIQHTKK